MKRGFFIWTAICCAIVTGCNSGTPTAEKETTPAAQPAGGPPKMGGVLGGSPESKIAKMKTPKEKAEYLRQLDSDSKFDPKMHMSMLETYSKDKDSSVAEAAKALLDKAK